MAGSRHSPIVAGLADEPLLAELKRRARAAWSAGDFPAVAQRELWPLGQRVVDRIAVRPDEDVLDVACGTGNAAIRAAQAGGRVAGLDLVPELLEAGRRLAADTGVEVDWVEGDAEELPFPGESFDVVVSTLGVMFAPRHEVAVAEIVRVLRPGGRFALCSWADDSVMARILRTIGRYVAPAPDFASPPWLWGSEEHVRSLFAGYGIDLQLELGVLDFPSFDSVDADLEFHSTKVGPFVTARALTEADGRWPALRAELMQLHEGLVSSEYVLVLGRKHDANTAGRHAR